MARRGHRQTIWIHNPRGDDPLAIKRRMQRWFRPIPDDVAVDIKDEDLRIDVLAGRSQGLQVLHLLAAVEPCDHGIRIRLPGRGDGHDDRPVPTARLAADGDLAALRVDLAPVAQVEERRQAGVRDEDDVPAAPAIAARRTAKGDVTLASKCHGSVAAIARVDLYQDFVDELHGALMTRSRPRRTQSPYIHGGKEAAA